MDGKGFGQPCVITKGVSVECNQSVIGDGGKAYYNSEDLDEILETAYEILRGLGFDVDMRQRISGNVQEKKEGLRP